MTRVGDLTWQKPHRQDDTHCPLLQCTTTPVRQASKFSLLQTILSPISRIGCPLLHGHPGLLVHPEHKCDHSWQTNFPLKITQLCGPLHKSWYICWTPVLLHFCYCLPQSLFISLRVCLFSNRSDTGTSARCARFLASAARTNVEKNVGKKWL